MSFWKRFALPFAGLTLAVAGALSLAVTTGFAQQSRPAATADQAMEAARVAQVAFAVYHMDNAGLHALDEATAAGTIPAGALGRVRRARIVAQAIQWPEALQADAKEFVEHALHLEEALRAEDARAAAPHATEVHELGHKISAAAYNWLASLSGAPASGGHGGHDGH